jgi:2-dehydro-3-deoxy-D-arabinonate dehydratase
VDAFELDTAKRRNASLIRGNLGTFELSTLARTARDDRAAGGCYSRAVRLVRYRAADATIAVGVQADGVTRRLAAPGIATLLAGSGNDFRAALAETGPVEDGEIELLAPIDGATEVWAAGVTYRRSRDARMEEAREADPYDRVYEAERPELFFKSVAWRVRGPGQCVGVRLDSTMDVPEPELALVLTATGEIVGYTVCNDMTSRSIEGENPLYLPQAKTYAGACALGPGILVADEPRTFEVEASVTRAGATVWSGRISTSEMIRTLPELARWLFAGQDFPAGAILSTGTGLVPALGFSLQAGDTVSVAIDGIGTLTNPVMRGKDLGDD